MAALKTKKNDGDVVAFLETVAHKRRREDGFEILRIMKQITGEDPCMWGDSIIGFGAYNYKTKSGDEYEWFRMGFSPRKQSMSLYIMDGFKDYDSLLTKLGKHKKGKACLYINKLADVDMEVLQELLEQSWGFMRDHAHTETEYI